MRSLPLALLLLASLPLAACFPSKGIGPDDSSIGDTDARDPGSGAHPGGWDHGLAAKHQEQDCQGCHGQDLTGGSSGTSCDRCHPSDWRSDCTFCHGGDEDQTGAPPEDMDDSSTGISFPEHGAHLVGDHPTWDCDQCHLVPTDPLSAGHLFEGDGTPTVAEVTMAAGLSAQGSYGAGGSCSNLYCHGDGAGQRGSASSGDRVGCGDCHGDAGSSRSLSGRHRDHMSEGLDCGDCHRRTVTGDENITGPDRHVNGTVDVDIDDLTYDGRTCNGSCHNERHSDERWEGGGGDDD
jgi:predicted small secreted protein